MFLSSSGALSVVRALNFYGGGLLGDQWGMGRSREHAAAAAVTAFMGEDYDV